MTMIASTLSAMMHPALLIPAALGSKWPVYSAMQSRYLHAWKGGEAAGHHIGHVPKDKVFLCALRHSRCSPADSFRDVSLPVNGIWGCAGLPDTFLRARKQRLLAAPAHLGASTGRRSPSSSRSICAVSVTWPPAATELPPSSW